jgi:hypothetical protein
VSERVYEPYEKTSDRYWCWFKAGVNPSDVPAAVFDALGLPSSQTVAAYPTREAALAALDAARAKAEPKVAWLPYMSLTEAEWVEPLNEWDLSRLAYEYRNSQDRGFLGLVVKELERRDATAGGVPDAASGLAAACEEARRVVGLIIPKLVINDDPGAGPLLDMLDAALANYRGASS